MARRPFIDGAGASTTPNKLKKYKLSKEGGLVEVVGLSTLSNTEIGLSGNKSDVRNIEDLQRNDTVLVRNIKEVQDLLTTESGTRSTSDTTLQNNIDAEETARISAVNTVSSNLTSEESSRTIADSGLDARVSTLETAPTYAPLVSSATVPLGPNAGDQWYNTDTNVLYIYLHDGDSSQWIDISTDTLMADYVASSTYTSEQAAQDTLISNTLASVSVNAGNISTETTRATAAEGVNAAAIAAETTRATAAEGANVTALAGKVDDGQVLTNVPASAVFTDTNTTYSVGDGGLTEKNFTSADNTKLDGIAASANNYSHPGTHDASMLTGTLPAISGANLTNLPAGGHTISIGQGTSTWYHNYPCGVRRTTVTLNARSFFPRIEENSYGTRVHEDHPHVQGVRTGGGSSIPGGVGSNYTVPLTIFQDFMCDHGRGAGGRISWEYLTYS